MSSSRSLNVFKYSSYCKKVRYCIIRVWFFGCYRPNWNVRGQKRICRACKVYNYPNPFPISILMLAFILQFPRLSSLHFFLLNSDSFIILAVKLNHACLQQFNTCTKIVEKQPYAYYLNKNS